MGCQFLTSMGVVATVIAVMSLAALPVAGQAPRAAADTWTPPQTLWGHPDLQGIWTNETITPFERPSELAGQQFLTEEEASQLEQQTAQKIAAADGTSPPGSVGGYNNFWMDSGTEVLSTRQTSLVVDPPGRASPREAGGGGEARRQPCTHHRLLRVHEPVGPLHHARRAGFDVPHRLQQRLPDSANS